MEYVQVYVHIDILIYTYIYTYTRVRIYIYILLFYTYKDLGSQAFGLRGLRTRCLGLWRRLIV